jgi:transposase
VDEEVKTLNKQIEALVRAAAPELVELHGVGIEIAGQLLVTAGDNAERIRSEAAFVKLGGSPHNQPTADAPAAVTGSVAAGTAPPTASSGA